MPVAIADNPNGYTHSAFHNDLPKRRIHSDDSSQFLSNNKTLVEQNGLSLSNDFEQRRRVPSAATNSMNGTVENDITSNGTSHVMNGHALTSAQSNSCCDICIHLAYDIISEKSKNQNHSSGWLWKLRPNTTINPDSKYSKTLHRTVAEITNRHEILFASMVKKLKITRENFEEVFVSVVDDIFSDGQINWGRIVTVYALGGKMAQFFVENDMEDCLEGLADKVGEYVSVHLGDWITENGGWDAFVRYFPEQSSSDDRVWNGLLMGVCLAGAGLATLLSLR